MSNYNNQTEELVKNLRNLKKSMIRGGEAYIESSLGEADKDEEFKVHDIQLEEDELILFNHAPDCIYHMSDFKERSKINNALLGIMQKLFVDCYAAHLEYSTKYNKWMFVTEFRFLTEDQFKAAKDDNPEKIYRAVTSTFDPASNPSGVAETFMSLVNNQNMSNSDACKYASITKEAKAYLTTLLYYSPGNKKKKWIRGENYDIRNSRQVGYNGMQYNNIIAYIYLDAEKVLSTLCCTAENRNKYIFALSTKSKKINNMDELMEIHRYSKARRRKLSAESGVSFSNN